MIYSICMTQDGNPLMLDQGSRYIYIHSDNSELIRATYGRYPSAWAGLRAGTFLESIERAAMCLDSVCLLHPLDIQNYITDSFTDPGAVRDAYRRLIAACNNYPDAIVEVDT